MRLAAARPERRLSWWVLATFVALPAALFGLPAAGGATWLVDDNLIQNFPLRVLVGTDLHHGHLPLWDPYLWSGAPLLAGFNAGAAYPTTWLFAFLPHALAWVVNQALVQVVAAVGVLVLLRFLGRSWTAAGLGAAVFSYGGFMAAHIVHLDVVQAAAWLPWAFVALDRLAHRPEGKSATPWAALLGGTIGLMGLSGAVEPILDGGVVLAVYAVWLFWQTPARRTSLALGAAVGVGVGLLLAGAQLVPGALLQSQSQRAVHDYWYFTSGSMNKSLTILGIDPLLLGGDHTYPATYFATYNMPEVSSYIGLLPVMGLFGLLARRHRRSRDARQWRVWYGILVLGLVLTWGDFTPFGHVLFHVPLFNRQRLLSRNLLEVDLAAAVLFAVWLDRVFIRAPRAGEEGADGAPRPWRADVVLALVPAVSVVGLQIVLLAGGTWFPHFLHVPGPVSRSSLWPLIIFLTVPSVLAVACAAVVLFRDRLARTVPRLLVALVVCDLVVFNVLEQVSPDPNAASSSSAWANALAATVAQQGPGPAGGLHRVAMFDPDRFYPVETDRLGQPDLTILRGMGSVQGYGAVVDARYDNATGTHLQLNVTPAGLADGTFARLDLGVLVSVPEYFLHFVAPPPGFTKSMVNGAVRLPPTPPPPLSPRARSSGAGPVTSASPPPTPASDFTIAPAPAATVVVAPGQMRTQYFGTVLAVTSVVFPFASGTDPAALDRLQVGLLGPGGQRVTWLNVHPPPESGAPGSPHGTARTGAAAQVVATGRATEASGLVLTLGAPTGPATGPATGSGRVVLGAAVVRTAGQGTYRVDGTLRDVVAPGTWRFAGLIGVFCVFTSQAAGGRAWVTGGASGRARVVSSTPWGDDTIRVTTPRPATLVRAEQFATGWQATVTPTAGPGGPPGRSRAAVVQRRGLVQAVSVPAGTSVVRFVYRPHRVVEGLAASGLGVVAVLGLVAWPRLRRRRRAARRAAVRPRSGRQDGGRARARATS